MKFFVYYFTNIIKYIYTKNIKRIDRRENNVHAKAKLMCMQIKPKNNAHLTKKLAKDLENNKCMYSQKKTPGTMCTAYKGIVENRKSN
jgi:hypothetical protein